MLQTGLTAPRLLKRLNLTGSPQSSCLAAVEPDGLSMPAHALYLLYSTPSGTVRTLLGEQACIG